MKLAALLSVLLLTPALAQPAVDAKSGALFDAVAAQDAKLFDAYNNCDLKTLGGMRMVDLAPKLERGIPRWPTHPHLTIDKAVTHDHDGYYCQAIMMAEHTGAHVDAPAHMLPDRMDRTIDTFRADHLFAAAVLYDFSDRGLKPGDLVFGDTGWQEYAAVPAKYLSKMPRLEPMTHLLSVYGIAGLTAYFGLLDVGKPKAGETVVVSAAAGSVGSIVGQIAKIKGCRIVGIAGGKDKCHWLTSELGFDAAVDYKDGATFKALRTAAPKGIDVYFDNVGGDILEACIAQMNLNGRIACCGAISQYDGVPSAHGPRGVPGLIVVKRLTMQGFIVMDYMDRRDAALADLQSWVSSGKLKVQEDVISGLENTPQALIGLLAGENRGKRMVKV